MPSRLSLDEMEAKVRSLEETCACRQAALESMIANTLSALYAVVEARDLVDVSAAAGALAQAIELSLESPQLKTFRHLSVAV